jgi:hypothetical protein
MTLATRSHAARRALARAFLEAHEAATLRAGEELRHLHARYDCHFPPGILAVVRALEIEIAWREQE